MSKLQTIMWSESFWINQSKGESSSLNFYVIISLSYSDYISANVLFFVPLSSASFILDSIGNRNECSGSVVIMNSYTLSDNPMNPSDVDNWVLFFYFRYLWPICFDASLTSNNLDLHYTRTIAFHYLVSSLYFAIVRSIYPRLLGIQRQFFRTFSVLSSILSLALLKIIGNIFV